MKKIIFLIPAILFLFSFLHAQPPYKYDSLYKTIFASDLCLLAKKNPGLVLIDVRSAGEYHDTSQYNSLNMGHLKGAVNIEIDSIMKNVSVLNAYKNKAIVLYCSHSQRSRRVSKLLSENGFTDFYNLNGGMSRINQMTEKEFPCKNEWLESSLPYKNISLKDAAVLIRTDKELKIVDIRPAAQFTNADTIPARNIGRIKNAVNIPYSEFSDRIKELSAGRQRPILVYSESGDGDAARAAVKLCADGFTRVYHLLGGFNDLLTFPEGLAVLENSVPFRVMDADETYTLLKGNAKMTIYDTRPRTEFENKLSGRESYKNLGSMKHAINLEENAFGTFVSPENKSAPILIYGHAEAFRLGAELSRRGYQNVYLLPNFYDFIWSAFNVKNRKESLQFTENHAGIY
jgi:rhodanese-related sulfurtransferase